MNTRSLSDYIDILLSLGMAAVCLYFWVFPKTGDATQLHSLSLLLSFEFFLVHSGVFMAAVALGLPRWSLLIFFLLYGVFAYCFMLVSGDFSIIWVYLLVMLNRMLGALWIRNEKDGARLFRVAFIRAWVYVLLLGLVFAVQQSIPRFGLSLDFLEAIDYFSATDYDGFLPVHVAMCFGTLYYVGLALLDIWAIRYRRRLEKPLS